MFGQRMLPRTAMVAITNPRRKIAWLFALAALAAAPGCTPPGPNALMRGDELLRAGKPAEAVEKLKRATELLPQEPRAWNLLGVAYHRAQQPQLALPAYRQALARDRSNAVTVAHYNLGCLLLEQNNAAGAAEELRSYTLITNSAAGLAKLGAAQARLRRWDLAEPAYLSALRLEPKNAEALNGLGVMYAQRNLRDAAQSRFSAALAADAKYGPALLNSALLAQQNSVSKPAALQRYREYLAAHAHAPQAETVKVLARQLEVELTPAPPVNAAANNAAKSNALAAALAAANAKPPVVAAKTNANAPTLVLKTNQIVAVSNVPVVPVKLPVTAMPVTNEALAKTAVIDSLPTTTTVAKLPAPPVVGHEPLEISPALGNPPAVDDKKKPGFFSRLNPFGGKPKPATNDAPRPAAPRAIALTDNAPTTVNLGGVNSKPLFPRYSYSLLARPAAGNRANAERALQEALAAQRAGQTNEAARDYQSAIAADPSYFDAQDKAALLAFQSGDMKRALLGWETALALESDSLNTRFSFALALKQANYPYDAANELEKIIEAKPSDARAHLVLGNLFAQQLGDREKARAHYLKVLKLAPRDPQAAAIRFWLAANP